MPTKVKFLNENHSVEFDYLVARKHSKLVETLGDTCSEEEDALEVVIRPKDCVPTYKSLMALKEYLLYFSDKTPTQFPKPLPDEIEKFASEFEKEFLIKQLGNRTTDNDNLELLTLYQCAQFLQMHDLVTLIAGWIASRIMGICKKYRDCMVAGEKIRDLLHLPDDWTPEEKNQLRLETAWPDDED